MEEQRTFFFMTARFSIFCFLLAGILAMINLLYGSFRSSDLTSYVLEGIVIVLFGWGEAQLWQSTISRTHKNSSSMVGLISRIPLWFIAGGMGYEMGLLIAKKAGLLDFYEIPVKPLFIFGGRLGVVAMGIWHFRRYRTERIVIKKKSLFELVGF